MEQQEWRNISRFTRPTIPVDEVFSEKIRNLIFQYHNSNGCPIDYIVCVMTSTVAAAVYDRFDIQAKFDRRIPLTLYQFAIGDSGSMKSAPFKQFPAELQRLTDERNAKIAAENKLTEECIADLVKQLKNSDDDSKASIKKEILEQKKNIKHMYPYILTDPTLEALAMDAKECGECASVISSEATFVNVIAGKTYNGVTSTPNIDIVLKGFDAEYCFVSRVGKEHIQMTAPRICLCVSGQKRTLDTLTRVGEQVERGFPNRCLFYYPEQTYDHDALSEIPIDPDLLKGWNNLVGQLFNAERGKSKPALIIVEEDAIRIHDEYRNRCNKLAEQVRYSGEIKGWIKKQADKALRFAAVLVLLENPRTRRIRAADLNRAITFFDRYALPMAYIAYGITGSDLTDEQHRYMQRIKLLQQKNGHCTEGQLRDAIRAKDKNAFNSVLSYLKENDYIRFEVVKTNRKPCKMILMNPYYTG